MARYRSRSGPSSGRRRPKRPQIEHHADGSKTIHLDDRMVDIMEEQLQKFRDKFGREPEGDDPIFFDPDAATPQPMSQAKLHAGMLEILHQSGAPPDIIYAYQKTDRLVTPQNRHMLTPEEQDEWDAAVAEYHTQPHETNEWTPQDVEEMLLDPRTVGVGDFPPIIEDEDWIKVQVKMIADLGPEHYARHQLDVLRNAFTGYADLLAQQSTNNTEPPDEYDPRTTEEIRQDYLNKKQEYADDPIVCEVCDAGLGLLDAEIAVRDAQLGHRSRAKRDLRAAEQRMDAAVAALDERNHEALRDWKPGTKPH